MEPKNPAAVALGRISPEQFMREVISARLTAAVYTVELACGHHLQCSPGFLRASILCVDCVRAAIGPITTVSANE